MSLPGYLRDLVHELKGECRPMRMRPGGTPAAQVARDKGFSPDRGRLS